MAMADVPVDSRRMICWRYNCASGDATWDAVLWACQHQVSYQRGGECTPWHGLIIYGGDQRLHIQMDYQGREDMARKKSVVLVNGIFQSLMPHSRFRSRIFLRLGWCTMTVPTTFIGGGTKLQELQQGTTPPAV